MRPKSWIALATLLALSAGLAAPLAAFPHDSELLAGLRARSIGPATMSGRVAAIEALESNPEVVYVGAATGGVWKSVDGALTFKPIFDDMPVQAIGAIAVFQPAPDIVWVGTGESNVRNSASVGNGIYKSLDGGVTWSHIGLEKSERISRIVLHPTDPEVAWVAAMGPTWGDGEERGVFKTIDGGKTWKNVLFVDKSTGAADLIIDPSNPKKLFAAMWDHRRQPFFFRSGGPGSGLHRSLDGGTTWQKLTPEDGLPEGALGRIGLAIARSNPAVVYALVEAEGENNLLLRSDDGGRNFKTMATTADQPIGNRPFYYADLRVDPQNENRVYSLWSVVSASDDGGKTWKTLVGFSKAHPDHHAMWIDPNDSRLIYEGNDGGIAISRDRGKTWRYVENLPLSQFYHVRLDDAVPYNVYGGLQDNGSWIGPSAHWQTGFVRNDQWTEVHFGDGFDVVPDPKNPGKGYAMSQEGYLVYWDLQTGERRSIRPEAGPGEPKLRYNWNAAIAIDPFDQKTVYFGSQFVHRSHDHGETWEVISPDLTSNNSDWQKQDETGGLTLDVTGAENHTTLVTIAPSTIRQGVIWTGSDDGRLHVTLDSGKTWTSVESNVPGVPKNTWIPHIEPSRHDAGVAFVVFDDHRRSNWEPYVYKTTDFGQTWQRLANSNNVRGYALSIVQDSVDRELLFLGTEFGLWYSIDGGKNWRNFRHGLPAVSVMDLAIHPREHALVIATHGRGLFVIDDLGPLRELDPQALEAKLFIFGARPAQQYVVRQADGGRFGGDGVFRGENLPYGARFYFAAHLDGLPYPKDEEQRRRKNAERAEKAVEPPKAAKTDEPKPEDKPKGDKAKITVRDQAGKKLRSFEVPVKLGINRAVWDLSRDPFKRPKAEGATEEESFFGGGGPEVPPGVYNLTLELRDQKVSVAIEVKADPRLDADATSFQTRYDAENRSGAMQETIATAIERIQATRKDLARIETRLAARQKAAEAEASTEEKPDADKEKTPAELLQDEIGALKKKLDTLELRLWSPPSKKGILPGNDAYSYVGTAGYLLGSSLRAPSVTQLNYLARAEVVLAEVLVELNKLFDQDVKKVSEGAKDLEVELLPLEAPLEVPKSVATAKQEG